MDIGEKKQVSFKVDEANAKYWAEETVKKISQNNWSVGASFIEEMIKEVHSAPRKIMSIIISKNLPKPHKWLGICEPTNGLIIELDESRIRDPGSEEQDAMIEIDAVVKHDMGQVIVVSAENNDCIEN